MVDLRTLLDRLWNDYAAMNPQAGAIHALLQAQGEIVVNDHIALRTFDDPRVGLGVLARPFVERGYVAAGSYEFPDKKLFAQHFEHTNPAMPRVFISELKSGLCSEALRNRVKALIDQVPADLIHRWDLPVAGRPWKVSYATYEALRGESEYAAWLAAFGFRVNHFTVLVNALKKLSTLQLLNTFLKTRGFVLNTSGGEIKGGPTEYLEQSSTLASQVSVDFDDGPRTIPGCYYEFARRYPLANGKLFSGFVAKSADKIFESTDKR